MRCADITEVIFLCLFVFEVLFKLYAMGFRTYYLSAFNRFDCLVRSVLFSFFCMYYILYCTVTALNIQYIMLLIDR